jgi:hypothetical protein
MWAVTFAVATGSYTFLTVGVIGHTVLDSVTAPGAEAWLERVMWSPANRRHLMAGMRKPIDRRDRHPDHTQVAVG